MHLTAGVLLMLSMSWIFGKIAYGVTADSIHLVDLQVAHWFHLHARPGLTRFVLALTHLHGIAGILLWTAIFAAYLIRQKKYYWLLSLLLCVPPGMMLNALMKEIFQRARPSFEDPLLTLSTYSFPSGHTAGTTLFYGMLASYLFWHATGAMRRVAIIVLAVMMVALVGVSRIYLGVHYLSDVLAAIAAGCAWLALCLTGVSTLRRHREAKRHN